MNLQTVLSQLEQGLSEIVLPSSWCQGRTAFGGVSGALLFQAEDGIRDFCLSRGLGDVYKRQGLFNLFLTLDAE